MDPQGAVLCAWHIYAGYQAVAKRCVPQNDAQYEDVLYFLEVTMDRIDAFILRNSEITQSMLDEKRAEYDTDAGTRMLAQCGEALKQISWLFPEGATRANIGQWADEMLGSDRKPVMSPCI